MTLQQIFYAIEIANTGSMTKAAENLYISQPSLTSAVRELENEIGIQIFLRNRKGVTVTNDGKEFLSRAAQLYQQYEELINKYRGGAVRQKFCVSTQHYSFAVKAFVEMVKNFGTLEYEFAIRETMTSNVIHDTGDLVSEIGILYLSDFNRKTIEKMLKEENLEFHHLMDCKAYVYLWKWHPLAKKKSITFNELQDYPCLSFEQGDTESVYFAEEILADNEYKRIIKANDRATMLNLMVGLNGYTLCSGIICEELNGGDYIAVPFEADDMNPNPIMEIGYITKRGSMLSAPGEVYIKELKKYLGIEEDITGDNL